MNQHSPPHLAALSLLLAGDAAAAAPVAPPAIPPAVDEPHSSTLRQLTKGGENAEAYWLFDGTGFTFRARGAAEGCERQRLSIARAILKDAPVVAAAKVAQAPAFVEALPHGYEMVGEGGSARSGGEKQSISIARAILKDAPVVLLDQATASIDAVAEAEIQRAIDRLVEKKRVIVIAHRLRSIRRAHQIVVLDNGALVERGTHDELVAHGGLYAHLWSEQERARGWRIHSATGQVAEAAHAAAPTGVAHA